MSAAATAAGYLYASGRLRGRAGKEGQESGPERPAAPPAASRRRPLRVAAIPDQGAEAPREAAPREKPQPKIQYRTRRWRPDGR